MPNTSPQPLGYSVNDAIAVSSIKRTRLYELIGQGAIKTRKIGGRRIVDAESLRALVTAEAS